LTAEAKVLFKLKIGAAATIFFASG